MGFISHRWCLTAVYIVVPKLQPIIMKTKLANLLQKWTVSPVEMNVIFSHANLQEIQSKLHINGAIGTLWRNTYTSRDYKYLEEIVMIHQEPDMAAKSRISRKRGRVRTVSPCGEGKDIPYKQYSPCMCQPTCGKQCPCLQNGTCCEKYCGYLKFHLSAQKATKIASEGAIVLKVNVKANNAPALQLNVNVI
ncbi:hypothetical protein SASPL_141314 [Salvia splendens]|uniref:CXC domain-containing protein n=1 Tax=Salvia splendens TaxID=180675 RepID=A0A8X8WS96_SALSN|nr:hypothetical protein SASPL_141314 [Salvia splendens]